MIERPEARKEPHFDFSELENLEAIGEKVVESFNEGSAYALFHGVPLFNEPISTMYEHGNERDKEEPDTREPYYKNFDDKPQYGRVYKRHKNMLRSCRNLVALEESDPFRTLQVIGSRNLLQNKNKHVAFHTEEASAPDPSRVVSYWDAQPLGKDRRGDTIRIFSVEDLVQYVMVSSEEKRDEVKSAVQSLKEPREFFREGRFKAPIYDEVRQTLRYDKFFRGSAAQINRGRIDDEDKVSLTDAESFFDIAYNEGLGTTVQLQPGDVLFIDNHKAVHSLDFETNRKRLTYQLLFKTISQGELLENPDSIASHSCSGKGCEFDHIKDEWKIAYQGRNFLDKGDIQVFKPKLSLLTFEE
jgi:hypothetical protein